jgi:hypothetical protein
VRLATGMWRWSIKKSEANKRKPQNLAPLTLQPVDCDYYGMANNGRSALGISTRLYRERLSVTRPLLVGQPHHSTMLYLYLTDVYVWRCVGVCGVCGEREDQFHEFREVWDFSALTRKCEVRAI